jgi:hypothetical protein
VLPCSQSQASWVVPISELWKVVPAVAGQPDDDKVLTATGAAGPLCLTAPTAGALPAPVTAQPCDPDTGSPTTAQRWTVRGLADTPAQSYRIEDQASPPRCLATSALVLAPFVVRAVLAPCDASAGQKWNALPSAFRPQLRDVHED